MAVPYPQRRATTLRLAMFAMVSVAVVLADQWTKELARELLYRGGPRSIPLIGEYVRLTYVENRGAAFGLLQNQTTFFVLVGLVVISVIVVSFRYMTNPSPLLILCLGLQMGGAIGNLIDRLSTGFVVDFIDLTFWPVFNLADSAIVVGVALFAYLVTVRQPAAARGSGDA
jgi:signal peptidase II